MVKTNQYSSKIKKSEKIRRKRENTDKRQQSTSFVFFSLPVEHFTSKDSSLPQTSSSTSSYISDDCKVLYIETVIEVNKPVFYERTNNMSDSNQNSFEQNNNNHQQPPPPPSSTDTTEDELSNHPRTIPVRTSSSNGNYPRHVNGNFDSGLHNSSTTRRRFDDDDDDQLLFPPTDQAFDETSQPTLGRRLEQQRVFDNANQRYPPRRRILLRPPRINRRSWKNYFLRALTYGFILLAILLLIFFKFLDNCTQKVVYDVIGQTIIHVERQGLPTI